MLSSGDLTHIVSLSVLDTCAIAINILYIFIILKRTPPALSNYSALLFHIACVDLLSSTTSLMCCSSLQNSDFRVVLVYMGPCTLLSERSCHFLISGHANSVAASVLLILLSFAYRLWVVRAPQIENIRRHNFRRAISQFAITLLALLNMMAFYLGGTYEEPGFHKDRTVFSVIDLTGGIDKHLLARTSFLVLFLIYVVGFFSIISIRQRLSASIGAVRGADTNSHQQIYRSLLMQISNVFGVSFWMVDALGLVQSPTLRRSIIVSSSLFSLISPLINMYFIPPYRRFIKSMVFPSNQIVQAEVPMFSSQPIARF